MRITSIEAHNFKSLTAFKLDLPRFCCLVGINGAGKSTVLQFIDFLAQQARGDIEGWLAKRGWSTADVLSKINGPRAKKNTVTFDVKAIDAKGHELHWSGKYNATRRYCTTEKLNTFDAELSVQDGTYSLKPRTQASTVPTTIDSEGIPFTYQGSILSQLRGEVLPKSMMAFKSFLLQTESLDMLTPERLRQKTRDAQGSLGHGGRHLSAFVYELGKPGRNALSNKLKEAYKQLSHVYAKALRSGWKQLEVSERFADSKLLTEAKHVNDGLLRLIAIFAELASEHKILLFDEIENGINAELIEFVTTALVETNKQVVVTTHSPMILNFLEDDDARQSVILLYRTPEGHTESIPLFSIPSLREKLKFMGPGEAFVDSNLVELTDEIAQVDKGT